MEHLSLEIFDLQGTGSQFANLPENAEIHITDTSDIFASGNMWSWGFALNIPANAHIFGSAADIHGSRLHELIDKRKARLWAEGLPLFLGYLRLENNVDVDEDGNIDVNFESGQKTFEDMIDGGMANQVPLMDDILIGMALWRKREGGYKIEMKANVRFSDDEFPVGRLYVINPLTEVSSFDIPFDINGEYGASQLYPRMVYPTGTFENALTGEEEPINCLNTDYPYAEDEDGTPTHPYCNIALCYQRHGFPKLLNGAVDYSASPEALREYDEMPANRVNSAPCFYVLYWIRCLMNHLGIHIDENQMMDVEDMRRLFFVNTNCAHEVPDYLTHADESTPEFERYGRFKFPSYRYLAEYFQKDGRDRWTPFINIDESGAEVSEYSLDSIEWGGDWDGKTKPDIQSIIQSIKLTITNISLLSEEESEDFKDSYIQRNSYLHRAYATNECFPNVDISDIIHALENGFGVRFLFSNDYKRVRIVLLRNILCNSAVQELDCDIVEETKTENSIRGFRMTYGASSDDTHFYYKGFADKLPTKKELWIDNSDKHDYSQWDLTANYSDILNRVSAFNKTCYVTPLTGNAHIVKVDKDAKLYDELHPSLFEAAPFMDAEDGDCTGEEETIETINVGFTPAIMNDVNAKNERENRERKQRFALFVDEEMGTRRFDLTHDKAGVTNNDPDVNYDPERLYESNTTNNPAETELGVFKITSDAEQAWLFNSLHTRIIYYPKNNDDGSVTIQLSLSAKGHVSEGYQLYLQDNFEPNDDGISPIEKHDWGLTLGIMRGSGDDARVDYTDDPDDDENDTWEIVPGTSVTAHPDTCDFFGNEWDYNGTGGQVDNAADAIAQLEAEFPNSNAPFHTNSKGYISDAFILYIKDDQGEWHDTLVATSYSISGGTVPSMTLLRQYPGYLNGHTPAEIMAMDAAGYGPFQNLLIELDSKEKRRITLLDLCRIAYGGGSGVVDNGIGSREGRISLKLRAEKPNPYFNAKTDNPEDRYLSITKASLQRRGIIDQFYKEYSYLIRNGRIANFTVRMTLAQLFAIDKTVRVTIGDVTGFIKKMEYTISQQTGLGLVKMEILYI